MTETNFDRLRLLPDRSLGSPSNLISWIHSGLDRGFVVSNGRAGWMKPAGGGRRERDEGIRHNMRR
jgi:hypothetical protein